MWSLWRQPKGAESKGEISVSLGGIQRMQTHPALQVGWHKFGGVNLNDTIEAEIDTGGCDLLNFG